MAPAGGNVDGVEFLRRKSARRPLLTYDTVVPAGCQHDAGNKMAGINLGEGYSNKHKGELR